MIKEKEVTKTTMEPESVECDCCHKIVTAEDCAECLYSEMAQVSRSNKNSADEFHLCDECFDDIVSKNNISVTHFKFDT